jgi:hypothetical protein
MAGVDDADDQVAGSDGETIDDTIDVDLDADVTGADVGADVTEVDVTEVDDGTGREVAYDCAPWAAESRAMLASLLESEDIEHVWQGTTVSIRAEDRTTVDALVDEVEAAARPALSADVPRIVYSVAGWPVDFQTALADALTAADLPYEWDEAGDLMVSEEHEAEVEAILELLPDPDDEDDLRSADDGLAVHKLFDRLFAAAAKLAKSPTDGSSVLAIDSGAVDLEQLSPPFGFEPAEWAKLVGCAESLRSGLNATGDDAVDDDEIAARAAALQAFLARYV